jgi:hypothetical protein
MTLTLWTPQREVIPCRLDFTVEMTEKSTRLLVAIDGQRPLNEVEWGHGAVFFRH